MIVNPAKAVLFDEKLPKWLIDPFGQVIITAD